MVDTPPRVETALRDASGSLHEPSESGCPLAGRGVQGRLVRGRKQARSSESAVAPRSEAMVEPGGRRREGISGGGSGQKEEARDTHLVLWSSQRRDAGEIARDPSQQ